MLKTLFKFLVYLLPISMALPVFASNATPFTALYYCSKPVANVHAEPQEMSEVASQIIYATPLELIESNSSGWSKVRLPDQYVGWVFGKNILKSKQDTPYPFGKNVAQVKTLFGHVYRLADVTPYPPLMTLTFGARIEIVAEPTEQNSRWIQIRLLNGSLAWIQRGDVTTNPQPLTLEEVLTLSKQFLGLPYTWGGNSSYGADCSGFIKMLFKQMEIELPHNAHMQAHLPDITYLTVEELEPGDLIFFGKTEQRVTHVGLYLGNHEFIHATVQCNNPVVQISDIRDQKWREIWPHFLPARLPQVAQGKLTPAGALSPSAVQ
jgi:gamma-D-glutamyl-L-lysine dipeptidyl-peptidase